MEDHGQDNEKSRKKRRPFVYDFAGRLPQSGYFLDSEWAAFFDIELKTFRKLIREQKVPHKSFGRNMVIDADVLFSSLPEGGSGKEE